uniref:Serpentine receptor class gamma n=1 Tax=Panagrellus redivivus TaxID=6233 RepID=A0A7E4VEE8_PANRE
MVMDLTIYYQGRLLGAPIYLDFVEAIPTDGAVPMILMFIGYGSIYCGQLLNAMISFNRFSVIYLKANYVEFWKKYLKLFLLFAFVIPLCLTIQFTVTQPAMLLYDESDPKLGYYLKERINKPIYDKSIRSVILFGFTGVSSLCMNCYVLKHLMQHRKKTDHSHTRITVAVSMNDLTPINARFLAYNISTFVFECMIAIVQVGS